MKFTTQKAALCHALLNGDILTTIDGFTRFGITNLPREISRQVEKAFGVTINKHRARHTNMFGEEGYHFVYRLTGDKESMYYLSGINRSAHRKGLKLMQKYVEDHTIDYKNDSHYVKTYPAFSHEEMKAFKSYADAAAKRAIPVNRLTTKQIIENAKNKKK